MQSSIAKLRTLVAERLVEKGTPELPTSDGVACDYDELFYLRYILSFGMPEKAVAPVMRCFEFRAQPEMRRIAEIMKRNAFKNEIVGWIESPRGRFSRSTT